MTQSDDDGPLDARDDNDLTGVAAALISAAAALVPINDAAADQLEAILKAKPGLPLDCAAALLKLPTTPAMWSIYLQVLARRWEEPGARQVCRMLAGPEPAEQDAGDAAWSAIVAAAVEALNAVAQEDEAALPRLQTLHRLAIEVERAGDAALAYDLSALALDLGPPPGEERGRVAAYAVGLAVAAERTHQVAFCAVEVARCRIALAGDDAPGRLAAFDACEIAAERIWRAEEPFRTEAAARLHDAVLPHSWLHKSCARLVMLGARRADFAEALGSADWPARVQSASHADWTDQLRVIFDVMLLEQDIESQRLALEPPPSARHANIDWVRWTLEHPAYSRAVPHNQSFLREKAFDQNVLVLMHEITHALCLIGGIGKALTTLRVVALDNELFLWGVHGLRDAASLQAALEQAAVAPLPPGDVMQLLPAERGIELTRKAQALQDAWSPWFEGLAVFAESAADPAADAEAISPVAEALRNLIDFHPEAGPSGTFDDQSAIVRAFEALAATFESRVSAAIGKLGWQRLHVDAAMLRERHYFAGYLAVRAVVAAWRRRLARPISGAEVLTLLLHATRFGTVDAVPDLGLPADEFASAAISAMASWAARLAELPASQLETFLAPPSRTESGRSYRWLDGLLRPATDDDPEVGRDELAFRERIARQAQASLLGDADSARLVGVDATTVEVAGMIAEQTRSRFEGQKGDEQAEQDVELINLFLTRGSLFPLGRSLSGFYLNVPPDVDTAYLMTHLRTTEAHAKTGLPSVNGYGFPISRDAGGTLARHFAAAAMPRLAVTRVIDLGGVVYPGCSPGMHVLVWHHEDWIHLQGPTQAADKMLREDAGRLAWAHQEMRHRLNPSGAERAELIIATGKQGARRTRDWIDGSDAWEIPEFDIAVPGWAAHVRAQAERLLDESSRSTAWHAAAEALLAALWAEPNLARRIAKEDYLDLTAGFAPERVTRALFASAQRPAADPWLDKHAAAMADSGLPIFERTAHGWDVRAATHQGG